MTTEAVDFVPLQHDIAAAIRDASATHGQLCVVVPKGGAGLLVFRNTPETKDELAPIVNAALLPRSVVLPIVDGVIPLAPYEDVILVDCESKSQRREVIISVTAESAGEPS